jgi:dCTP diphosphatase
MYHYKMSKNTETLESLADRVRKFSQDRDWDQFHSPKNLSMALSVEAAELMEIFQWSSQKESKNPSEKQLDSIKEEVADIAIYLIRIADILDIDLPSTIAEKIKSNDAKYPIDKSKGSSKKYTDL